MGLGGIQSRKLQPTGAQQAWQEVRWGRWQLRCGVWIKSLEIEVFIMPCFDNLTNPFEKSNGRNFLYAFVTIKKGENILLWILMS